MRAKSTRRTRPATDSDPDSNQLLPDPEKQCYELVRHNFRNPDPATTTFVGTVRGLDHAQRAVEVLDGRLTPEEREAGFGHYLQEVKSPLARKPRRPLERQPLGKRRWRS